MVIVAQELGKSLIEALGRPKHTLSFTLQCRAGAPAGVECEYVLQNRDRLAVALMEYDLAPRLGPAPIEEAPACHFDDWHRQRINVTHAKSMERTSYSLRRDWRTFTPEEIYAFINGPGV